MLTAGQRPDGAFGFRMFHESSSLRATLYREVATGQGAPARVRVEQGTWDARDQKGLLHRFAWTDRVRRPELAIFDQEIHASYGAATQVARFQAALDDVAVHLPNDAETRRLAIDLVIRRNGREPYVVHLISVARTAPGGS